MKHYSWILPGTEAFLLYDSLPESSIFEGENGQWHVDYYCGVDQNLEDHFLANHPSYHLTVLPDQDWVAHSAIATPPVVVGDFYVHTPHYPPSEMHRFSLCIGATMAFGSGHHDTTQGCLKLIQDLWKQTGWTKALDFGCGSGILAMAMNCISPGSARGIDNDPDAIRLAKENAILNHCPTLFILGDSVPLDNSFDCIVANVYGPILIDLAPQFACASHIILSGILKTQAGEVIEKYTLLGWQVEKHIDSKEWSSLWLKKIGS